MKKNNLFNLKKKTAFVFGGNGLLGKEISKILNIHGAKVVVLDLNFDKKIKKDAIFFEKFNVSKLNLIDSQIKKITNKRILNAKFYDKEFKKVKELKIPKREKNNRNVFHLYVIFAKKRNQLLKYCLEKGIECKIHYPKELYLQKGLKFLNYKRGDFPVTDWQCKNIISFPVDQYLSKKQLSYVTKTVINFYNK